MYKYRIAHSHDDAGFKRRRQSVTYHARIRLQAFHYVGAFYVAWFFPTIFQLVIVSSGKFPFPLLFLTAFFVPCQVIYCILILGMFLSISA